MTKSDKGDNPEKKKEHKGRARKASRSSFVADAANAAAEVAPDALEIAADIALDAAKGGKPDASLFEGGRSGGAGAGGSWEAEPGADIPVEGVEADIPVPAVLPAAVAESAEAATAVTETAADPGILSGLAETFSGAAETVSSAAGAVAEAAGSAVEVAGNAAGAAAEVAGSVAEAAGEAAGAILGGLGDLAP